MIPHALTDKDLAKVAIAASLITQSLDKHYTIVEIAKAVRLSDKKLKRGFKQTYGMGVYTYLKTQRLLRAKVLMLEGKPMRLIVPEIGYACESNFSKAFRKTFKEAPATWRRGQLARTG